MAKCPTCNREPKRSSEANRRYWSLLAEIADKVRPEGKVFSRESWHKYFAGKLIGMKVIDLPSGKSIEIPESTTGLDKGEFAEYSDKIEAWAAQRNVWLEE